ncbi:MAG: DUF5615 family PIN-like protein [Dehalococcoidia bacterium]
MSIARSRNDGHDCTWIAEDAPRALDDIVLRTARERAATLLTADKDFGGLVISLGQRTFGIVLIRPAGLPPDAKAEIISTAMREYEEQLVGASTVILPGSIRIRRLDP